jgi:geranylgeranyl diphosphate synthase type II
LLEYIHDSKTGALLRACVRCGALAAGAGEKELEALAQFGRKIGRVFQIVDDILDVTSSSQVLGKTAGKDAKVKKATYPALYGIEASRQRAVELVASALMDIRDFGEKADILRSLAQFIISRTA